MFIGIDFQRLTHFRFMVTIYVRSLEIFPAFDLDGRSSLRGHQIGLACGKTPVRTTSSC